MKSFCCGSKGILPEGLRSDAEEFAQSVKTTVLGAPKSAPAGPRRWDICLVAQPLELSEAQLEKIDPDERQAKLADFAFKGKQRKDTYAKLRRAGIDFHFFTDDTIESESGDPVSQFVLLSISDELLKSTAARIGMEKQLKPTYFEGDEKRTEDEYTEYTPFREYTKETHDDFAPDQSSPDCARARARPRAGAAASGRDGGHGSAVQGRRARTRARNPPRWVAQRMASRARRSRAHR